jgi:hypothetical protein
MIDWSKAPEGATHFCETSGTKEFGKHENGIWFFAPPNGEWRECAWQGSVNFTRDDVVVRPVTTPTLETMLTEWRDLEARAQAAQAEADALFEHAGQCHGEIAVRLAELGWGAPRGPMVPGEPVVTLDDNDGWIEWNGGECPVPVGTIIDQKLRDGREYFSSRVGDFGNSTRGMFWRHDGDKAEVIAYRLTPSTQP